MAIQGVLILAAFVLLVAAGWVGKLLPIGLGVAVLAFGWGYL